MKNKFAKLIGVSSIAIILILTGCNKTKTETETETGAFNNMSISSDKYVLKIESSKPGHPSRGNAFSTFVEIKNKTYNGNKYSVWYDIDYSYINEHNPKEDFPDIDSYNQVKINNKSFKYTIDSSSINLIYQPNNIDCYITIKVSLTDVFDKDGNSSNEPINISIDDLSLKEIADTINFDIEKK